MCMCSGIEPTEALSGAPYVQAALQNVMGAAGPNLITVAMILFAFTTLLGNFYYVENLIIYILKKVPSKTFMTAFRLIATAIVFVGALVSAGLAWDTADLFQAIMVVINIPVILLLGKPALDALKDYQKQRKEGKNPVFKAADIGLKEKTDFWN